MKDWFKANNDEIVCYCLNVDKQTVVNAIKNGSQTLAQLKESTKACTGGNCKTLNPKGMCCSADLLELIRIYGNNQNDDPCCNSCCCK